MNLTRNSDGTYTLLVPLMSVDLYNALKQIDLNQLAQDAGQSSSSGGTTTPPPSTSGGFHGIYAFSGDPSTLVNNPNVAGCVLKFAWSDIQPLQGSYQWDVIDKAVQPWVSAGKKVILRVSTSGWKNWSTPSNSSYTPAWVYKLGVKSVISGDGAIKPQYWAPVFLSALKDFITAFAGHYDGNSNVALVQMGIGDGGETSPNTRKTDALKDWQAIGYTDQVWLTTIKTIVGFYQAAFRSTPLVLMPDNSFLGGTAGFSMETVMQYAASVGVGLQDNGLTKDTKLKSDAWGKVPFVVAEQRDQLGQTPNVTLKQLLDVALGTNYNASYVLLFSQDLIAANQSMLATYAAKASK